MDDNKSKESKKIKGLFRLFFFNAKKENHKILEKEYSKVKTAPVFQLRLIKRGEKNIFYRVLQKTKEKNDSD